MSLKKFKKSASKRKQNGKKLIKGQASKMKQKCEMEITVKEQISELDKEILSIKINEVEGKLNRKMHLCSYMEEELSICRMLYSGKLFLKSESMRLLNEAFQDFASEIFLLDQEYESMKSVYANLAKRQHFCVEYQKRVDMLNALGAKLEENLLESEKCFDEFPVFVNAFAALEARADTKKEKYNYIKEEFLIKFDRCLLRIENEVNLQSDAVMRAKNLKVDLLPASWQALFRSEGLSSSWLESSLECLECQQRENSEFRKKYVDLLQFPDISMAQRSQVSAERKESSEKAAEYSEVYLYLQIQNLHQEDRMESLHSEMADLEKAIHSLEISGETSFEKSYLLQIVHKAGSFLKQYFEIV